MRLHFTTWILLGLLPGAIGDCCYTGVPDVIPDEPGVRLFNITVQPATLSATIVVEVHFSPSYIMNPAQPYRAPIGTVSCRHVADSIVSDLAGPNIFQCTAKDATGEFVCGKEAAASRNESHARVVFSAQFNMMIPVGSEDVSSTVHLLETSNQHQACLQREKCEAPATGLPSDGLLDFGPLGRHPKWFAVVLAACGGFLLALIWYLWVYYRNQVALESDDGSSSQKHLVQSMESDNQDLVPKPLQRVPTIRQAKLEEKFGQEGTLIGTIKDKNTVQRKGTLMERIIANGDIGQNGANHGNQMDVTREGGPDSPLHRTHSKVERNPSVKLIDRVASISQRNAVAGTTIGRQTSVMRDRHGLSVSTASPESPIPAPQSAKLVLDSGWEASGSVQRQGTRTAKEEMSNHRRLDASHEALSAMTIASEDARRTRSKSVKRQGESGTIRRRPTHEQRELEKLRNELKLSGMFTNPPT
ncbi:hypothetical protein HDU85_006406 [Gaertneriomyces sp. JEL0708]|nr:hypothetical protein HDU85_006406 [Gaertneriomyces sp. JEL0708]